MSAGKIPAAETTTRKPRFGHLEHTLSTHTAKHNGGVSHSPAVVTKKTATCTSLPKTPGIPFSDISELLQWRAAIHAATRQDLQTRLKTFTDWRNQPATAVPADIPPPHTEAHAE